MFMIDTNSDQMKFNFSGLKDIRLNNVQTFDRSLDICIVTYNALGANSQAHKYMK